MVLRGGHPDQGTLIVILIKLEARRKGPFEARGGGENKYSGDTLFNLEIVNSCGIK